ncbi:Puromycin N-acetyltransferase [Lasiodiplodia theobromae]|uniref:Puromycin N-acetyltransferase n=1 Tax=Lasiodiplodia theobromae TaxID=45133 RepID=A0A5N5DCU5_9PEZI|nr:Puromycin N-acetyltransferase [Lasiodiplodia theobromae]
MPLTPPYTLSPITEADFDACMANATPAFAADAIRLATFPPHLVDPQYPDEESDFRRRRLRKRLAAGCVAHKIVDPDDTSKIAAWAVWIPPQGKGRNGEEGEKKKEGVNGGEEGGEGGEGEGGARSGEGWTNDVPKCAVRELWDVQISMMKEAESKVFGEDKNFWYLATLSCHPDYQGKGLGAALVKWGLEQAEKDGVPVYLEATPSGKFLYAKLGFETVIEYDMARYVPEGVKYVFSCMLWKPKNKLQ